MQPIAFNTRGALISCLAWILLVSQPGLCIQAGSEVSEQFQRQTGTSCLSLSSIANTTSGSFKARSRVECAKHCTQDGRCSAFAYLTAGRACHLLDNVTELTGSCGGDGGVGWQTWVRVSATQNTTVGPLCQNGGEQKSGGKCKCYNGYVGNLCEKLMEDCQEGEDSDHYRMGSDPVLLTAKPSLSPHNMTVMCMGKGRTVILRQSHTFKEGLNFTWDEYLDGFTKHDKHGAHWIGLRNLYYLSNSKTYKLWLSIRLQDSNTTKIRFSSFKVVDNDTFTAQLGPFLSGANGSLADLLVGVNGSRFTTYDHDDGNSDCAQKAGGGWWFGSACPKYNLVGKFSDVTNGTEISQYVFYDQFKAGTGDHDMKRFMLSLANE